MLPILTGFQMYIDPGSGGLLFQILAGLAVGASGMVLFFAGKIKMGIARIKRRFRGESADTNETLDE